MNKIIEDEFYIFLTTTYMGINSKKLMSKKSAKDCIYRVKYIEKILKLDLTSKTFFKYPPNIDKIKYEIKILFLEKNGSRRFAHTPYIFSLNRYIDYHVLLYSNSLAIK